MHIQTKTHRNHALHEKCQEDVNKILSEFLNINHKNFTEDTKTAVDLDVDFVLKNNSCGREILRHYHISSETDATSLVKESKKHRMKVEKEQKSIRTLLGKTGKFAYLFAKQFEY